MPFLIMCIWYIKADYWNIELVELWVCKASSSDLSKLGTIVPAKIRKLLEAILAFSMEHRTRIICIVRPTFWVSTTYYYAAWHSALSIFWLLCCYLGKKGLHVPLFAVSWDKWTTLIFYRSMILGLGVKKSSHSKKCSHSWIIHERRHKRFHFEKKIKSDERSISLKKTVTSNYQGGSYATTQ